MFTPIHSVLESLKLLNGKQVSITGHLLVGGDNSAFVASSHEAYTRAIRLRIDDGCKIERHLLATLPVYGGGDVIFDETVFLTGTLAEMPGEFVLTELTYCKVVRDDKEIIIPL